MSGGDTAAGLHITVAPRPEDLLPPLFDHIGAPDDDPFESRIVVVPNQGVAEWVRRRVAQRFGVAANIELLFPGRFRARMLDEPEHLDPWAPRHLTWTILGVLQADRDAAPGFRVTDRPLDTARRIAELFDRYAVYRPEMVRQWAAGRDVHRRTPEGWEPVPAAYRWQPELWRTVQGVVGTASRAEDAARIATVLAARVDRLPTRVALLGASTLGGAHAGVVEALAAHARVEVMLLAPAPIAGGRTEHHPLIATWAVPSRETVTALAPRAGTVRIIEAEATAYPSTLLGRLQHAVASDDATPRPARNTSDRSQLLERGDGSVQIHGCHGAVRQVEALRDAILHLLVDDPTLSPRDVLVVVPDLERFAPLVEPVLGAEVGGDPGPEPGAYVGAGHLPALVQDRSLTRQSEAARAMGGLVGAVTGRATASELRELLELGPVAAAYELSGDDHARIRRWIDRIGIRWGLDANHRADNGYPRPLPLGTWREAIERLALGAYVQTPVPREVGDVVPHDDVSDQDLHAIGMLAAFVDDLLALRALTHGIASLSTWNEHLGRIAAGYRARVAQPSGDVLALLDEVDRFAAATVDRPAVEVGAAELVAFLTDGLNVPATRRQPLTDAVTVCSTIPRRGVPARVVAILGFDERAVQRQAGDGDDLLALHREPGEPDRGLDQRQALLDAVLAARNHLIITFDAHSPRDNRRIPPPIALDELLDAIADRVDPDAETPRPILVEHTRQLTHPVNLGADPDPALAGRSVRDLMRRRPWTFEEAAYEAVRIQQRSAPVAVAEPDEPQPSDGPAPTERVFGIADLVDAFTRPAACYLQDVLGVDFPRAIAPDEDAISLWPDPRLEAGLGRDYLAAMARGTVEQWLRTRARLGGLPPGAIADEVLATTRDQVAALLALVPDDLDEPRALEIDLRLPHRDGTVVLRDRVEVNGSTLLRAEFVKWDDTRRVRPLVELAMAMLTEPDRAWQAVVVTRPSGTNKNPVRKELTLEDPEEFLRFAVELLGAARSGPVAFLPRSAWASGGSKTARQEALRRDLLDPYAAAMHGDLGVADLDDRPEFARWAARLRTASQGDER